MPYSVPVCVCPKTHSAHGGILVCIRWNADFGLVMSCCPLAVGDEVRCTHHPQHFSVHSSPLFSAHQTWPRFL